MYRHSLSARNALNIAAQYGFSIRQSNWHRAMIRDGIIQAREAEARPRLDGRRMSAVQHFDSYMSRTVAIQKQTTRP